VRNHTRRVLNRRKPAAAKTGDTKTSDADAETSDGEPATVAAGLTETPPAEKPAPGARPVRPTTSRTGRPSGKRNPRRR